MILENLAITALQSWLCEISTTFPNKKLALVEFQPFKDGLWRGIIRFDNGFEEIYRWLEGHDDLLSLTPLQTTHDEESKNNYVAFVSKCHETLNNLITKHKVFIQTPVFLHQGKIFLKVVSTEKSLKALFEKLEESNLYRPSIKKKISLEEIDKPDLTEKQFEILRTAVELGYYEIPRDITSTELAEMFDISLSTLSEHLRKAESQIIKTNVV